MPTPIPVILTNRYAQFLCNAATQSKLREFYSYAVPGAEYSEMVSSGEWDGRRCMYARGRIGAGLFVGAWKAAREAGFRFLVKDQRETVQLSAYAVDPPGIRPYQQEAVTAMLKASNLGGLMLLATGCLSGNTLIDMPRDLKSHPVGIPLKDLVGKRPYVYAFDDTLQRIVLRRASRVWKTGEQVPVYKVTFKVLPQKSRWGGRWAKFPNSIIGTPDHLFMLRQRPLKNEGRSYETAGYKKLIDLQPGDRLMPFLRRKGRDDTSYSCINLNNGEVALENRFVLSELQGGDPGTEYVAHHRDEHRYNQVPSNLEWKTPHDHRSQHVSEFNRRCITGWQKSGIHPRGMAGKHQSVWHRRACHQKSAVKRESRVPIKLLRSLYVEQMLPLRAVAKHFNVDGGIVIQQLQKYKIHVRNAQEESKIATTRYQQTHGVNKKTLQLEYCKEGLTAKEIAARHKVHPHTIVQWMKQYKIWPENNHVVEKVEFYGYEDVYDMTVPKVHNFVANGVVVHNSGKTFLTGAYLRHVTGMAVFCVDELTLLTQAQRELEAVLQEKVGVVGRSEFKPARVTVATVQTLHLHRRDPQFLKWYAKVDVMIIDEIHVALNRRNIDVVRIIKPKAVFGLTATLEMHKPNVAMEAMALTGPVIFRYSIQAGVAEGYLTQGHVVRVMFDDPTHQGWAGSPEAEYRLRITCNQIRNECITALAREGVKAGHCVIVLAERIQHLKTLSRMLSNTPHRLLHGAYSHQERFAAKEAMDAGTLPLILASRIFSKGIDIRKVDVIIDAAAMSGHNGVIQKFGRGVRVGDGKTNLLFIDIADRGNHFEDAARARLRALKELGVKIHDIPWASDPKSAYGGF